MIPINRKSAESLVDKRKGTTKICCIFCERRLGWYDAREVDELLSQYGVTLCDECKSTYMRWYNERTNFSNQTIFDRPSIYEDRKD